MSNLEHMRDQILLDAKKEAEGILAEAKEILNGERTAALDAAKKQAEDILSRAEKEEPAIRDRVVAETERAERNEVLSAKQSLVERVFAMAADQLKNLPDAQYQKTLDAFLKQHPLDAETVLEIPKGRKVQVKGGKVQETEDLTGGFRVRKGGVRENFDFVEVMQFLRRSLEQDVIRALSEGETK